MFIRKTIGRVLNKTTDVLILSPIENILARMARVEDLMLSGMSDEDARRSVSADWVAGVRRWNPIVHDIEMVRAIRPDIAAAMESDARKVKRRATRRG